MGFSQTDVAHRLGLESTAIISRWERGISLPGMINAMHLSKLYKTLLNELFWELDRQSVQQLFPNEYNAKNNDP